MPTANKYKACKVFWSQTLHRELTKRESENWDSNCRLHPKLGEVEIFASKLEFGIYKHFLSNNLLFQKVKRQSSIELIPKSPIFPKGKNWKVDFIATDIRENHEIFIEAKGYITQDFPLILALLQAYNPQVLKKLWIVFERMPGNTAKNRRLFINLCNRKINSSPKILSLREFQEIIK